MLVLYGSILFAQDTIYIDPTNLNDPQEDGTNIHPFDSWDDLTWTPAYMNSKTFLQKRGTEFFTSNTFEIANGSDIVFGAYGGGIDPIILSSTIGLEILDIQYSKNITVKNLIIKGDTLDSGKPKAKCCIRFWGAWNNDNSFYQNNVIDSCNLINAVWGIRNMYGRGLTVSNTEVQYIGEDGIYCKKGRDLKVLSSYIHDVNTKWFYIGHTQAQAPGDCIQMTDDLETFLIEGNVIDKSNTGNKFCIIYTDGVVSGVIKNNTMITAPSTSEGGSGIYVGSGTNISIEIKNNTFEGELSGISSYGAINAHHNIFTTLGYGVYCYSTVNQSNIYNNIFYHNNIGIRANASDIKNNIFLNMESGNAISGGGNWTSDYNCYYGCNPEEDTHYITDSPKFVDTANLDFHLLPTSPCIDAGTDVGLTLDADGTPLPQGNGFDMGVFEYIIQGGGGDEIYIDPTNSGNPGQNGTMLNPYDNWEDIPWSDTAQINGKSILQKRGTICETSSTYTVTNATGVTIGSYGDGDLPVLYSTNTGNHIIDFVWSKDCIVKDLIVRGDTTASGVALSTSAIRVYGYPYQNASLNNNIQIENCTFENAEFGVRLVNIDGVTINNCEISNIEEDGIYANSAENLEISYCNIHDVNLKWFHIGQTQAESPGDGIELVDDCSNYNIHHNTIDRSNSGNKFCFSYSALSPNSISGVFDHNECITPLSSGDGGAAIYIGQGDSQEICYNTIEGELPGVITMSDNLNIYYNIFKHLPFGILSLTSTTPTTIENNVFHDVRTHIQGGNLSAKNNIFDFTQSGDVAINLTSPSVLDESNNLYSNGTGGNNSVIGDPMFVNPSAEDFHLQDGSPCFDAGLDIGLSVDMDSISVPQGLLPEIGIFELIETNTSPEIEAQSFALEENSNNGTVVGTVVATDPDAGQALTYSITSGNTNNAFNISSATGELTVSNGTMLDYETTPTFNLTIQVQDNGVGNLTAQATITVNLTDVNEVPIIQDQGFAVAENTTNGIQFGAVTATDPDNGQTLTFSITSGNTNNAFNISSATGELTVSNGTMLDYETTPTFNLTIQVQDNGVGNLTAQATITVNLTDVNEVPVIQNQSFTVAENATNGTLAGTVTATDPDNGQTLTFSITSGNTNSAFNINSTTGELTVSNSAALDYEATPVFSLTVQVQDNGQGSLTDQATITVNLTDQNEAPVIYNQSFTIEETIGTGELVGVVQASDPDNGQTLTFSIASGNIDNAFAIDPLTGELTVADSTVLDFTTYPVYYLNVEVQDDGAGNLTDNATVTVSLSDVNQVPEIEAQSFALEENSNNGAVVGTVVAIDPDAGQTLTFSIISGNIGDAFVIDSQTGELTVTNTTVLDYETTPTFNLTVQVQDNGVGNLTAQATVTVNLTDVNETPEIEDQSFIIAENSANGELVGVVQATDPDNGQALAFNIISGNVDNAFAIDPLTGELTVADSTVLNFTVNPVYYLNVEVQDNGQGNLTDDATITVVLTDVNQIPEILAQSFALEENSSNGAVVGTVVAIDPDAGQTLTFSITSGNIGDAFAIDSQTGELTVINTTVLDYETTPVFSLTVQVQDNGVGNLTAQATITVNLTDVNEIPEMDDYTFEIDEFSPDGVEVGIVEAIDPDNGQTITYSITAGNTDDAFDIDAMTGVILVQNSEALDYGINPQFNLIIKAEDNGQGNLFTESNVTIDVIQITQMNEPGSQIGITMSLFPNPSNGNINIDAANVKGDKLTIKIFNVRGEQILDKEYENCTSEFSDRLHVGEYPKGVYIIYLINEHSVIQEKFVKL